MKKQMKSITDATGYRKDRKGVNKKIPVQLNSVVLRMVDADDAWSKVMRGGVPVIPYWAPGKSTVSELPSGYFYPSNKGISFCESAEVQEGRLEVSDCDPDKIKKKLKKDEDLYKNSFGHAITKATTKLFKVFIAENQSEDLIRMSRDMVVNVHIDILTSKAMREYLKAVKVWAKYSSKEIRDILTDAQCGIKSKKIKKDYRKKK